VASTGNRATASASIPPNGRLEFRGCGPISVVAAEIHRGNASEHRPRWLAFTFIQNMCQRSEIEKRSLFQSVVCFAAH
jgi:hypothetical protein